MGQSNGYVRVCLTFQWPFCLGLLLWGYFTGVLFVTGPFISARLNSGLFYFGSFKFENIKPHYSLLLRYSCFHSTLHILVSTTSLSDHYKAFTLAVGGLGVLPKHVLRGLRRCLDDEARLVLPFNRALLRLDHRRVKQV